MEIVLAISGIVGSVFTVIGVLWAITFGSQSLTVLLGSSRSSTSEVKVKTMSTTRSKPARKVTKQAQEEPSIEDLPFGRQWVAETGRMVTVCWLEWALYWGEWSAYGEAKATLSAVAGLAMRVVLVLAPILLTIGLTLWAIGTIFGRHTVPLIGEAFLAGFLIAVASGFFLLGLIGAISFFNLVFARDL